MCGTHARGCLIDGLPFQHFRRPPMSSENVSSNKVKTLNNKPFLLQHPNHKQKSYGTLSQQALSCILNQLRAWLRHTPYLRITRNFKTNA
ncbi:hypothetical protein [Neisseria sp. 27098_8_139]|uniref:hypothetical protein n=1 Tax=Neisseria sp. 27098_8_139 TaxID=3003681 RepID=UPI00352E5061